MGQGHPRSKAGHIRAADSGAHLLPQNPSDIGIRKDSSQQSQITARSYPRASDANGRVDGQPQTRFPRPPPRYTQLYNPSSNFNQRLQYHSPGQAAIGAQTNYLDELLRTQSPSITISKEELIKKSQVENQLRDICCRAVVELELGNNDAFDVTSVQLQCFGSVGTGFAMPNSDMDLALLSPLSVPEPCSTDSQIPRLLEKTLLDAGYGARLLTKTRVPIIRFCEKPSNELRSALMEARTKWEAEEKSKEPRSQLGQRPSDHEKYTEPHSLEKDGNSAGSEASSPKNSRRSSPKPALESARSPAQNIIDNSDIGKNTIGEVQHTEVKIDQQKQSNRQEIKPYLNGTEGEDRNAPPRSDEDRIRLYKLAMKDGWYLPPERRIIHNFIHNANKATSSANPNELIRAREELKSLPNILSRHREHSVNPLDYPKLGIGVQCDINFSNFLALHNTKLLYCYSLCDPRVKVMVLFVKSWAKCRKINSPYHGTLSSYGYVLMVLHYLINVAKPPVLPNLQHIPAPMIDHPDNTTLEGYTVRFWRDEAAIAATVQRGQMNSNSESTGSLLRGFFHYFGTNQPPYSFDWMTQVLSLRTIGGILTKQSKGWTGAKTVTTEARNESDEKKEVRHRYLFAIEDPFELDHNVARTVVHNGIVAIRNEFRRAVSIIGQVRFEGAKAKEDLMAEAEEREHLQFKPFGHPPRGYGLAAKDPAAVDQLRSQISELNMS